MYDSVKKLQNVYEPSDVDEYAIAADGGLIYNPLSREAERLGRLHKYDQAPMQEGCLELGGMSLAYRVPKEATAYDMVPVFYTLRGAQGHERVHIGATAFEKESKRQGRDLYDLNLPGRVDMDFEYLGYIGGDYVEGLRPHLAGAFNDRQGSAYPNFSTTPLCRSGVIGVCDQTWFKIRYRNTGDTILDPDGNGSFQFDPILFKKDENGEYVRFAAPTNLFYRIFQNVYPGDTGELYIAFSGYPGYPNRSRRLAPGEYKLELNGSVRCELDKPDFLRVIWTGTYFTSSSMEFTIKEKAEFAFPKPFVKADIPFPGRNSWLHKYEEFLSSYDSIGSPGDVEEGVVWVQPAPWTEQIVLKLLDGNQLGIATAALPLAVESDSLKVVFTPSNENYVVCPDGSRYPLMITQTMADMRGNSQMTPYANSNIINDLLDMREAGVNSLTSTVCFAYDIGEGEGEGYDNLDAFKFVADVSRDMGLRMDGMLAYPFGGAQGATYIPTAQRISGEDLHLECADGYGDPAHSEAGRIFASYSFGRYGDNYEQYGDGSVPMVMEDTRGWIRIDIQNRYKIGEATKKGFRRWLLEQYGSLEAINAAWGSAYPSLEAIDPELDGVPGAFGIPYEYLDSTKVFHDYSRAMADLDIYRTLERIENYKTILRDIRQEVPSCAITLRTEGGNWIVSGLDPHTREANLRHVFYSQRHCAIMAELLQESKAVHVHSDYITLPYTPAQVGMLTALAKSQGILCAHLPQFNRMRDIAINRKFGLDTYKVNYHLKSDVKGVFINTLTAVFPWFKASYEAGGINGILWQDYLCDGYVTQTQYEEMRFYCKKLREALDTPEGRKWRAEFERHDESFRSKSKAKWSYPPAYIHTCVEEVSQRGRHSKFAPEP